VAGEEERTKVTGGCACGEIRFGYYEPTRYHVACHCRSCQYAAGGGPAYMIGVARSEFRITRGHPAEFASLSESGNLVSRVFCSHCGTHLYSVSEGSPETYSVKVGALDEPAGFKPRSLLWTGEAQPWHRKYALALRFRRNLPSAAAGRNEPSPHRRRGILGIRRP